MIASEAPEEPSGSWARVRAADPDAFGRLFDEFRDRVFWQALRHTGVLHDAEDITALVFLEAWRKRSAVRLVDDSPLPWLLATTNNVARNTARTKRRHHRAMERTPLPDREENFSSAVDDRLDDEARRSAVRAAFARLSAKDQDVISLASSRKCPSHKPRPPWAYRPGP